MILGAIIGDTVGSVYEFNNHKSVDFELFDPRCEFTDDSIVTVAVAKWLLIDPKHTFEKLEESLVDFGKRYPHPMGGYGGGYVRWLFHPDTLNVYDEKTPDCKLKSGRRPYNSWGNGSAMRVSAVGWAFDTLEETLEIAKRSAEITHNHPEGIKGAQCVAALIYWLRTCRITKEETERSVKRSFGYEIMPLKDIYRIGSTGHFDGTCQETVPMAIRCFIDGTNFEDVVRKAILCDGDTDTKGDIAGAIAEAYYEIPDDFIRKACSYLPHDMLDIITEFTEAVGNNVAEG
jgi:ADP-ribosylglycohydrolase